MDTTGIETELRNLHDTANRIGMLICRLREGEVCEVCKGKLRGLLPKLSEPTSDYKNKHRALASQLWSMISESGFMKTNCDFVGGINMLEERLKQLEEDGLLKVDDYFYQD